MPAVDEAVNHHSARSAQGIWGLPPQLPGTQGEGCLN